MSEDICIIFLSYSRCLATKLVDSLMISERTIFSSGLKSRDYVVLVGDDFAVDENSRNGIKSGSTEHILFMALTEVIK